MTPGIDIQTSSQQARQWAGQLGEETAGQSRYKREAPFSEITGSTDPASLGAILARFRQRRRNREDVAHTLRTNEFMAP